MKLYDLIIVEDEDTIRQGLVNQVPWANYGFRVAAEARHGREALELMAGQLPDAVLTDVKMPVLNGIDLMAEIRRLYPAVKVVILSGYGEFEYAQKGIEYGAFAYLLKPTKEKNIEDVFVRLKAELDNAASSRSEAMSRLQGLKVKFFEDILAGRAGQADAERIKAGLAEAGVEPAGPFLLLRMRLAAGAACANAVKRLAGTELTGCAVQYAELDKDGITATVAAGGSANCREFAQAAKQSLAGAEVLGMGVSHPCTGVMSLAQCLAEANVALEDAFYLGKGAVACAGEAAGSADIGDSAAAERQIAEKLAGAIAAGEEGEALASAARYIGLIKVLRGSPARLVKRFSGLLAAIEARIAEKDPARVPERQAWLDRLSALTQQGAVEDAASLLEEYVRGALRLIRPADDGSSTGISAAIEFINANFRRKLTLEEAAGVVYMTPSYFSRQFKARTGQSFIDYLTTLRLEKAKELLRNSDAKVYEASMQVGYEDYRHFCKVFRKYTGMSPMGFKAGKTGKPGVK